MLERSQLSAVLFFVGLGLLLIGVLSVATEDWVNLSAIVAGALVAVLSAGWWQMLKRR